MFAVVSSATETLRFALREGIRLRIDYIIQPKFIRTRASAVRCCPNRANTVRWDIDPGRNTVKLRDPASSVHKMAGPMLGCVGPQDGSVAKFRRSDSGGCKVVNCRIRLVGEPEQPGDEESLADRISFCQPSHSALTNHVHRFNSL